MNHISRFIGTMFDCEACVYAFVSIYMCVCRLTVDDRQLLWEKKSFCQAESAALPLVLASAPCWQWSCLPEIYALLRQWACPGHLDNLGLLHAS